MKRKFAFSSAFLAVVLSLTLAVSGCSFASTISKLDEYLPVGIKAFETILSILASSGVIRAGVATSLDNDAALASAALSDIDTGIAAYKAAPAADKATKLKAVITGLNAAQTALGKLEVDVHMGTPQEQAMINGLIGSLVVALSVFEVNLGGSASPVKLARASAAPASLKAFKAQFNGILVKGGRPDKQLR